MTYEESIKLLSCWLRCTETDNTLCVSKESCNDCEYDYDGEKIGSALRMAVEALELVEWMKQYIPSVLRHSREMKQIGVIQNDNQPTRPHKRNNRLYR